MKQVWLNAMKINGAFVIASLPGTRMQASALPFIGGQVQRWELGVHGDSRTGVKECSLKGGSQNVTLGRAPTISSNIMPFTATLRKSLRCDSSIFAIDGPSVRTRFMLLRELCM